MTDLQQHYVVQILFAYKFNCSKMIECIFLLQEF
jgi:hypothetical protein